MASASSANAKFGLDLFQLVNSGQPDSNGFISPFSISMALSMTKLGAHGDTAIGMKKALRWDDAADDKRLHDENRLYISLLKKCSSDYILSTANRLYVEKNYPIYPEFIKSTQIFYLAEAVSAQFKADPETERAGINKWVSEQTQDKIKDLLAPGTVDGDTRMILVNAIYFKGKWSKPFEPQATRPCLFKVSKTVSKYAQMMFMDDSFKFWMDDGTEGFSALEIPYKGEQLRMVILLPKDDFGLAELEKKLTMERLNFILSRLQEGEVELSLPRFELTCSYPMKAPLSQMGMATAFDAARADFSTMTGQQDLFVSDVVHKAFIKVNEEGSEAAAATAVMMTLCCALVEIPKPKFIVDHPFLFIIQDKRVPNSILFLGHVYDPSSN